jgi:hypothetical protein
MESISICFLYDISMAFFNYAMEFCIAFNIFDVGGAVPCPPGVSFLLREVKYGCNMDFSREVLLRSWPLLKAAPEV